MSLFLWFLLLSLLNFFIFVVVVGCCSLSSLSLLVVVHMSCCRCSLLLLSLLIAVVFVVHRRCCWCCSCRFFSLLLLLCVGLIFVCSDKYHGKARTRETRLRAVRKSLDKTGVVRTPIYVQKRTYTVREGGYGGNDEKYRKTTGSDKFPYIVRRGPSTHFLSRTRTLFFLFFLATKRFLETPFLSHQNCASL
jgi:hypothetical protein